MKAERLSTELVERLPTFIEGFDEALEGGIPKGSIVLIAGSPGTMKSTVTYHTLYRNALAGTSRSVYMTLEQSRKSLENQAMRFGIDFSAVQENLHVLDFSIVRKNLKHLSAKKSWMEVFRMYVSNLKESYPFDVLAIDSLDVLEVAAEIKNRRDELFYFFEWLRDLNSTVFLTSESSARRMDERGSDEAYLADGIISLSVQEISDVEVQRRIRCVKMRATNHSMDSFTFICENSKFLAVKSISK